MSVEQATETQNVSHPPVSPKYGLLVLAVPPFLLSKPIVSFGTPPHKKNGRVYGGLYVPMMKSPSGRPSLPFHVHARPASWPKLLWPAMKTYNSIQEAGKP